MAVAAAAAAAAAAVVVSCPSAQRRATKDITWPAMTPSLLVAWRMVRKRSGEERIEGSLELWRRRGFREGGDDVDRQGGRIRRRMQSSRVRIVRRGGLAGTPLPR